MSDQVPKKEKKGSAKKNKQQQNVEPQEEQETKEKQQATGVTAEEDSDEVTPSETDDAFGREDLQCRFYRNEWPEKDELVMVNIRDVNEDGAYVQLLEYNNREALILASSVTRKRVKNVKKLLKLGTQDCMQVISIDKDGGFIDLSKRTVQVTDHEEKKQYFDKSKIVHLIMRLTAHELKVKLIDLYEKFGWDLYDKFNFDHALDALNLCLTEPDMVLGKLNISDEERKVLLDNIHKKMAKAPVKLRAIFNLKCYTFEGIDAIRDSLLEAKKQTCDDQFELIFKLDAPPKYFVQVETLDKQGGVERLEKALAIINDEITSRDGKFSKVQGPTRVGTTKNEVPDDDDIKKRILEQGSSDEEDNTEHMNVDLGDDIEDDDDQIAS